DPTAPTPLPEPGRDPRNSLLVSGPRGYDPRPPCRGVMASDAPSLSDAIATDFLTCPICLERLRRPKILPCLHTYCQGCLEGLLGDGPGLRCPECREDVSLPQGVTGLKTNFFVNGLLELVRPVGEAGLTCALCPLIGQEDSRPAVSHCLDCADSLCQACAAGHRCSRLTHAHRLVSLQGYLSGEHDEEIRQRQAVRCPEHPAEELRFLCRPCAGPICRECRLGPHLEHPCETLEEAAEARRPLVAELLAGVEEMAGRVAQGRAALEEELEQLRRHEAGLRDVVKCACADAAQRLLAQQEEVLAALRRHMEGREKAAGLLRTELELQEQLAHGTADVARKVLALGRPVEIVSLEALITQRLGRLRGFRWEPLGGPRPRLVVRADLQNLNSLFQLDLGAPPCPAEPGIGPRRDSAAGSRVWAWPLPLRLGHVGGHVLGGAKGRGWGGGGMWGREGWGDGGWRFVGLCLCAQGHLDVRLSVTGQPRPRARAPPCPACPTAWPLGTDQPTP
uniref:Tripartite motif containing 56 n=1 Tax=Chrysemys picta bellii TaxID=8478 RepID=A0A8C3FA51_CHRPI